MPLRLSAILLSIVFLSSCVSDIPAPELTPVEDGGAAVLEPADVGEDAPVDQTADEPYNWESGTWTEYGHRRLEFGGIVWRVLEVVESDGTDGSVRGSKIAFLLADEFLDDKVAFRADDAAPDAGNWVESDVRVWLNEVFLSRNFTLEQQQAILETSYTLGGPNNQETYGKDTVDTSKVFLLSVEEAENPAYFEDADDRMLRAFSWFLRSPGSQTGLVTGVNLYGYVITGGTSPENYIVNRVRPAMRVNLDHPVYKDDGSRDMHPVEVEEPEKTAPRIYIDVAITREQAGLDTIAIHALNDHAPDESLLLLADGSTPYTDGHFAQGIRHGMEYPFMRFRQRDMALFTDLYIEPVIAGLKTGDAMSRVAGILGEPTLEETVGDITFFHYKADRFYISFMGRDTVEMIGLKRAGALDYDRDVLKNWRQTLVYHRDGEYLEYREKFFQSLNKNSWMGGISVSNVGLIVSEYESAIATVYNDFQGNLYMRAWEGEYDPDTWAEKTFDDEEGGVRFVNEDSNFLALRGYMSDYAELERQFAQEADSSPTGRYLLLAESVRPYDNYLCFRASDMQTKDRLHTWMSSTQVHWLDDAYFIVTDMIAQPRLYHVEREDELESAVIAEIQEADGFIQWDTLDLSQRMFTVKIDDSTTWTIGWSYGNGGELEMYQATDGP